MSKPFSVVFQEPHLTGEEGLSPVLLLTFDEKAVGVLGVLRGLFKHTQGILKELPQDPQTLDEMTLRYTPVQFRLLQYDPDAELMPAEDCTVADELREQLKDRKCWYSASDSVLGLADGQLPDLYDNRKYKDQFILVPLNKDDAFTYGVLYVSTDEREFVFKLVSKHDSTDRITVTITHAAFDKMVEESQR